MGSGPFFKVEYSLLSAYGQKLNYLRKKFSEVISFGLGKSVLLLSNSHFP